MRRENARDGTSDLALMSDPCFLGDNLKAQLVSRLFDVNQATAPFARRASRFKRFRIPRVSSPTARCSKAVFQ